MPQLREFFRPHGFPIAGVLYLVAAVVCTQIPLFNYLGFESSFTFALVGSFIAGFLTIGVARRAYLAAGSTTPSLQPFRFFVSLAAKQLALLLLPLAVLSGNALFVPNCDFGEGFAFFLLLPAVSVVFVTALGIFCTVHYRHPRWVFMGIAAATFAHVILLGYYTPSIFSYNFFYGYFPGFSYDELLPLGWPLVFFRIVTLCAAGVLVWCAELICNNSSPELSTAAKGMVLVRALGVRYIPVSALLVIGAVVVYMFRCELGWESSRRYVQKVLGGKVETAHFTIYYDSTATAHNDVLFLIEEHEFRLHQVLDAFALTHTEHIASYVYPSATVKRRLIGAGETEFAKPWSNEVHITRSSVEDALKHELVHVVAAPFGMRILHASTSPGLTEGLAVAVDGLWGYRTLPEYAAAMRAVGIAPPIQRLMTPAGFMSNSSMMSYVMAGAFCRHLIDRYGMRPLLQVYKSGDYDAAYGVSLDSLIAEWHRAVDSTAVTEGDRAAVDVFFRRPPIFGKVCARVHARRLRTAGQVLQERRYDEARDRYARLYAEGRSYEAFAGLLTSEFRLGNYSTVVHLYDSVISSDRIPHRYLALGVLVGDAQWMLGNTQRAESLYRAVRVAEITPGYTEGTITRLALMADSVSREKFKDYFVTVMSDTARIGCLAVGPEDRGSHIARYMRGRLEQRLHRYGSAASVLATVEAIAQDSTLEALRRVSLGDALLRCGRLQEAREWYWTSLNYDTRPFAAERVDDRLERCDWLSAHPLYEPKQ